MIAEFHKVEPYLLGRLLSAHAVQPGEDRLDRAGSSTSPSRAERCRRFRREEAKEGSAVLKLQGLDPNAAYVVENVDGGKIEKLAGRDLMSTGLEIKITEKPAAALFVYRKGPVGACHPTRATSPPTRPSYSFLARFPVVWQPS